MSIWSAALFGAFVYALLIAFPTQDEDVRKVLGKKWWQP